MWFLIQGSVVFAVVASNIHWQWTPNPYLASLIGVGLALLVTVTANGLIVWARKQSGNGAG